MIQTIKKRSEFVKIGKDGVAVKKKSVIVLCLKSDMDAVGYTASRRVGNAVLRNRAKRRLRHLVREFDPLLQGGFSFVLIATSHTPKVDFSILKTEIRQAIERVKSYSLAKTVK